MNKSYDDIIHLPHHVSATHPHMSMAERAAQFSPFAALTGYEDVLTETARKTEQKIELDETIKEELDQKLHLLAEHVQNPPSVSITYFQPDDYKEGGTVCNQNLPDQKNQFHDTSDTDNRRITDPDLQSLKDRKRLFLVFCNPTPYRLFLLHEEGRLDI